MKIGFLNPQGNFDPQDSYWTEHPDFGGQLVYVKEVAIALAKMGHQVDILTRQVIDSDWPEFAAPLDQYPNEDNLRIVRLPCGPDKFLAKEELWPHLGTDWATNIIDFYAQDGGGLPDIFTTHYGDGGLAGVILQDKTGIPFTFTGHSLGAQKMDKLGVDKNNWGAVEDKYKFSRRIAAERLSMNHAAAIITSTSQEKMEQYGHGAYHGAVDPKTSEKFAVTPPGVNRIVFSPEPTGLDEQIAARIRSALERDLPEDRRGLPLVLAASRLDPKKNHLGIVEAFAASDELRQAANLAIVVRGLENPLKDHAKLNDSDRKVMEKLLSVIEAHNLHACVTGFPLNSQLELAASYRTLATRQSVFILTALYEPFGLAPLEAMSCGLPAVVTKNGGPSESMVEDGVEYGVLVDPKDPQDTAAVILRVVGSANNWQQFHQAGIDRVVNKYTWDRTAEGYIKVFAEVIDHPKSNKNSLPIPNYFQEPNKANGELLLEELKRVYAVQEM